MRKTRVQLMLITISCAVFFSAYYWSYSYFNKFYAARAEQASIHNNINKDTSYMRPTDEEKKLNEESNINVNPRTTNSIKMIDRTIYEKEVFLTFDDGPSENNTPEVLKILRENNVKATFFIIGAKARENPQIVREMAEQGMSIEPHTYSHDYKIYRSEDTYFEDLDKCIEVINKITEQKGMESFVRLPGGSDNLVSERRTMAGIRKALIDKGIFYVDWNVSSADAAAGKIPMDKILSNVLEQCQGRKMCVVLMHDSYQKGTTVDALPYIITGLKQQGFVFRTFNDLTSIEKQEMIRQKIINR